MGQHAPQRPGHPIVYEFWWSASEGQGELRIASDPRDDDPIVPFFYRTDPGQEFLQSVAPVNLGEAGDALRTDWAWGAGSLQLVLFALGDDRIVRPIFRGVCKNGFEILHLDPDQTPEICQGEGDLFGPRRMRIYRWECDRFTLTETRPVKRTHVYAVTDAD